MGRLLHIAEREVKQVQTKHEEINGTDDLNIYLDWGRDGEERLELLTTVTIPKRIIRILRGQN